MFSLVGPTELLRRRFRCWSKLRGFGFGEEEYGFGEVEKVGGTKELVLEYGSSSCAHHWSLSSHTYVLDIVDLWLRVVGVVVVYDFRRFHVVFARVFELVLDAKLECCYLQGRRVRVGPVATCVPLGIVGNRGFVLCEKIRLRLVTGIDNRDFEERSRVGTKWNGVRVALMSRCVPNR